MKTPFSIRMSTHLSAIFFNLLDLVFFHTCRGVNAHMAVFIFETLRCRFDLRLGTQILREQTQFGKVFINKDSSF